MVVTATTRRRRSAIVTDEVPRAEVAIGDLLGERYRIERLLGEGGMGRVYCAEHRKLGRKVAIKVLARDRAVAGAEDRFAQEAVAMAKIGHPNIVDVIDFGETPDGAAYIVMELLDGEDLRELIARGGPRPWAEVRDVVVQICQALQAAHDHGVVHRDLKPENVFLVRHGEQRAFVKVLDFGIAKLLERTDRSLTAAGGLVGTPEYMSPEQARGVDVDHRADIYSVGTVAYEMLTGDVPFTSDTFMGVLLQQINDPVPPPSQRRPDLEIPPAIESVVMRALAKSRDDRYASMSEMAAAFSAIRSTVVRSRRDTAPQGGPEAVTITIVTPPPVVATSTLGTTVVVTPEAPSVSRRWLAPTAALAAIASVVTLAILFSRPGSDDETAATAGDAATTAPPVIEAERPAPAGEPPPSGPPQLVQLSPGDPSPVVPTPLATAPRRTPDEVARGRLDAAMKQVEPVARLCAGSIGGGAKGDRVRVRVTHDGRDGAPTARAQGTHAGTKLGACVERAAATARVPALGQRVSVVHTFVL